jgi:hypothetical protein
MATTRRLWVPVLVGLLVAVLLGPAGVTATEPRTVTAKIMIPAAAFIPSQDVQGDWDYNNTGAGLQPYPLPGRFVAPVPTPEPSVSIRRITIYASDGVCVELHRFTPAAAAVGVIYDTKMTTACTALRGGLYQTVYSTVRRPSTVNRSNHGLYLWADIDASRVLRGVQITYTYETTP